MFKEIITFDVFDISHFYNINIGIKKISISLGEREKKMGGKEILGPKSNGPGHEADL